MLALGPGATGHLGGGRDFRPSSRPFIGRAWSKGRPGSARCPPARPERTRSRMYAVLLSTAVIFVAELGDKSQLMAMTFAARYRVRDVLVGITAATAIVHLASVGIGYWVGDAFAEQQHWISIVAGVAFLGFAAWTLRGDELTEDEAAKARASQGAAILAVGVAFFLAELGDKTMLATITLATQEGWLGTWIGSTVGMVAADALAIGVGALPGREAPPARHQDRAAARFA